MTPQRSPAADAAGSSLVEGEFAFTREDFTQIASMLHDEAGIALPETKATLVYSRLAKRLRALRMQSFRDYCALIADKEGAGERMAMLAALTTNVTRFFREPHHFEHLKTTVLPPLLEEARKGGRVRIWSSACSSGQEPYSIALTLLSLLPEAGQYDIKVLASDIDPNMIADGKAGIYGAEALEPVPAALRDRWFEPAPGDKAGAFAAKPALKQLITFRTLNLIREWPMKGPFQAIFCRNVAIYFDDETQARLWSRMAPLLSADGVLYIGHSERVNGPAAGLLRAVGITTYLSAQGASK
jgi:chemotaxis protein methyltransferase CheR